MKRLIVALCSALAFIGPAQANFAITVGSGTTIVAIDSSNQGTSSCAAGSTECPATVLINTAGTANSAAAPIFAGISIAGAVLSATNGIYSNVLQGNAALSATNGLYANLLQGNTALSTTNGLYANLLQGNAVLSGTNPLPGNIAQMGGTAINSGCVSNYGTAPSAVACLSMNAFVTNANPNPGPLKLNALSTTVTAIKSSAGTLSMLQCGNTNASEGYVQVFNLPSGSVTLGTTAPTLSIPIAATSTGGFALAQPIAMSGSGISAAATTTATGSSALGTALDCNVAFN